MLNTEKEVITKYTPNRTKELGDKIMEFILNGPKPTDREEKIASLKQDIQDYNKMIWNSEQAIKWEQDWLVRQTKNLVEAEVMLAKLLNQHES